MHLNTSSQLPPTHTPLLLLIDGEYVEAMRLTYIQNRDDQIEYYLECGKKIFGRYKWTYQ